MIKQYRAEVFADKWPYKVDVEGTSWSVAASRAVKQWNKRGPGKRSRSKSVTVRLVRVG